MRINFLLTFGIIIFLVMLFSTSKSVIGNNEESKEPTTVEYVDLEKYVGLWYEIAKIPNRFQRKCVGNTTAFYSFREDGRIDVVNRCSREGRDPIEAKGIARVLDTKSNAKLKVSFVRFLGLSLFWGDYWILGLGEEYDYAIVGTPNRKYGWILSRHPSLSPDRLNRIFVLLRDQGYNPADFEMTVHSSISEQK